MWTLNSPNKLLSCHWVLYLITHGIFFSHNRIYFCKIYAHLQEDDGEEGEEGEGEEDEDDGGEEDGEEEEEEGEEAGKDKADEEAAAASKD